MRISTSVVTNVWIEYLENTKLSKLYQLQSELQETWKK
jgi:hypothetical protein